METPREYYLGFDGGGTKTECVLLEGDGRILARGLSGPSNPLRAGFEQAFSSLMAAGGDALSAARIEAGQVTGACAGLAGAGRPRVVKRVMGVLVETFPKAHVHVTTDLEIALEAAVGEGSGIVLVAGTGSGAYGRDAAGRIARAGGYGAAIGDEGSAFDMGRRAVSVAAGARDALAAPTRLVEMIPAGLDCADWSAMLERIAEAPDEVFPRIFPIVAEAADAGDSAAQEILFRAAFGLAKLALSVARRLNLTEEKFTLGKAGGVWGRSAILDSTLDALVRTFAERADVRPIEVSCAHGAARLAQRLSAPAGSRVAHGG